jgi:hypothetical protein
MVLPFRDAAVCRSRGNGVGPVPDNRSDHPPGAIGPGFAGLGRPAVVDMDNQVNSIRTLPTRSAKQTPGVGPSGYIDVSTADADQAARNASGCPDPPR